jgi:type IV pilus assembly protein PilO
MGMSLNLNLNMSAMPQMGKQLAIGALLGLLFSCGVWFALSGKRADLAGMRTANGRLDAEVKKGVKLKANYETLKKEVEEQETRIAELVALLPLESERARVAYSVQKLASASALGQVQNWANADKPVKNEYCMEYPTAYRYSGGFHEFGRFLSFVSGFEKIINISDITMTRETGRAAGPASIEFRLSIYVYDPKSTEKPKAQAGATPAARRGKDYED